MIILQIDFNLLVPMVRVLLIVELHVACHKDQFLVHYFS